MTRVTFPDNSSWDSWFGWVNKGDNWTYWANYMSEKNKEALPYIIVMLFLMILAIIYLWWGGKKHPEKEKNLVVNNGQKHT